MLDRVRFSTGLALPATHACTQFPAVLALAAGLGASIVWALALPGVLHQAWPSAVLNAVWFVVAVVTLVRGPAPGRPSTPRAELEHARRRRDDPRVV